MQFKDYYEILGRRTRRGRSGDQDRLPPAGAQVPPRRQQGSGRRGQVQGGQRGLRGAARSAEARGLRPVARARLPARRRSAAAARRLRRRRRAVSTSTRSSPAAAPAAASATSSRSCSAARRGGGFGSGRRARPQPRGDTRAQAGGAAGGGLRRRQRAHRRQRQARWTCACPRASSPGQVIRLGGQGGSGGDLLLEIEYAAHPQFEVDGRNIIHVLPVAPWEAALGATVSVPTLGGPVELKIPADSEAGRKLRLRGRGLPGNAGRATRSSSWRCWRRAPHNDGAAGGLRDDARRVRRRLAPAPEARRTVLGRIRPRPGRRRSVVLAQHLL